MRRRRLAPRAIEGKRVVGGLVVLNAVLLAVLVSVSLRLVRNLAREASAPGPRLVGAGAVVGEEARAVLSGALADEVRRSALVFWPDSTHSRAARFVQALGGRAEVSSGHWRVVFVCGARERCAAEPAAVGGGAFVLVADSRGALRKELGVVWRATVIVSWPEGKVLESYPYALNPVVLYERLQREES
ncbi:MAG: hypothetical protein ONB25_06035 [candidate division KSB1 bacterium]|nr:hypothetical protein [candidate division KSB1 bacterium]